MNRLENVYCFYTVDFLPNVLLGRLAGDKIADMEALDDEQIIQACEFLFETFFKKDIRGKVKQVKTSKWKTNGNFSGTYSFHSDDKSVAQLVQPLLDKSQSPKVLFAGEATHDHFFSTVHGAIESGFRESKRLTDLYSKKQ